MSEAICTARPSTCREAIKLKPKRGGEDTRSVASRWAPSTLLLLLSISLTAVFDGGHFDGVVIDEIEENAVAAAASYRKSWPESGKARSASESRNQRGGNKHKLQRRSQWQGRGWPAANCQAFASSTYVRRKKRDQQHGQARRGDGGNRRNQ
jgi:hypothetical protein